MKLNNHKGKISLNKFEGLSADNYNIKSKAAFWVEFRITGVVKKEPSIYEGDDCYSNGGEL